MILYWVTMPGGNNMKIRIDFTDVEKEVILDSLHLKDRCKSQKSYGKYGEISYFKETNMINMDLSERFIISFSNCIGSIANMTRTIITMCENFDELWFSDEKTEDIKLVCPVTRIKKD